MIQRPEASPVITVKAYKVNLKRIQQDSPSVYNPNLSSTTESDEDAPCDASSKLNPAESGSKLSRKICQGHRPAKPSSSWKIEARRGTTLLGIEMISRKTRD